MSKSGVNRPRKPREAGRKFRRDRKSSATPGKSTQSVAQQAYEGLIGILFSGELRPNDVIMERRIAEKLGISRTPLREAIRRLEGEKLLQRQQGGAIAVCPMSSEDFLNILSVRRLLEGEAARKAAGRIPTETLQAFRSRVMALAAGDDSDSVAVQELGRELHLCIARSSGNPVLALAIEDMGRRSRLFIRSFTRVSVLRAQVCKEHLTMISALMDNDGERAKAAREQHIDNIRAFILEKLSAL